MDIGELKCVSEFTEKYSVTAKSRYKFTVATYRALRIQKPQEIVGNLAECRNINLNRNAIIEAQTTK